MTNGWQEVPLGKVLKRADRFEKKDELQTYRFAGTYSFARGIFAGETKEGSTFRLDKIQRIRKGDFIYCKIMAWEGAFGIAPEKVDDCVMSGAFVAYEVDQTQIDPKFLDYYFKQEPIWKTIGSQSTGTNVRRRSLHPHQFEKATIPLPPLTEQRRIVAHIESLAARVNEAQRLREEADEETNVLLHSIKAKVFESAGNTTVKDFADIQSGYAFKSEWFTTEGIRLVRNVNIGHGDIRWSDTARIPIERQNDFPAFELQEGDILISLDRPLISSGLKAARVRKQDLPSLLLQRVGRVIFKNGKVLPDYFYQWLNSPSFISSIDPGRSNGVPHISPKDVEKISFAPPPLDEQRRIVAYLDGLQAKVNALRELQVKGGEELSALMASVLDRAFKGEL